MVSSLGRWGSSVHWGQFSIQTKLEEGSNVDWCCGLHERIIWVQVFFFYFQKFISIEEIQRLNEKERRNYLTLLLVKALVCLTFNFYRITSVYLTSMRRGQHDLISFASNAKGDDPESPRLFQSTTASCIFFRFPACFFFYNRWAWAWVFSLVQAYGWRQKQELL